MEPEILYDGQEVYLITNRLPLGVYLYGIIAGETHKDILIYVTDINVKHDFYGYCGYYISSTPWMLFPYRED
jgi:hypothetical protein